MDNVTTTNEIRETSLKEVWDLRHRVMYPDLDAAAVQLPDDERGRHYGLYVSSRLVSVISCFDRGMALQFRKFATEVDMQGRGYGSKLLAYVMEEAVRAGKQMIWCNARVSATALYTKFGMHPVGDTWEQFGLTFIRMEKEL